MKASSEALLEALRQGQARIERTHGPTALSLDLVAMLIEAELRSDEEMFDEGFVQRLYDDLPTRCSVWAESGRVECYTNVDSTKFFFRRGHGPWVRVAEEYLTS